MIKRFDYLPVLFHLAILTAAPTAAQEKSKQPYFPTKWSWATRTPAQVGMDAAKLDAAVVFAKQSFNKNGGFNASREPYPETIGPTKPPSGMNGIILRHGYIVAEWGNTREVDMTFSVTKTYLSTTAGLALDQGLIRDVKDAARGYVPDGSFDATHNQHITWHQLLNQTSGWEGTLWDKPDWSDRYRKARRPSEKPGEHWRYNDVRVNQLALSLLHVWREPLPKVLKKRIMDPIGASSTWRWHGYRNSWLVVDGARVQSVSGGGHWGGGMFINSRDQARFGYLFLRDGNWNGKQLVSKDFIKRAKTPTPQQMTYGYMNWFLNTAEAKRYRAAPVGNVFFVGAGTNIIWLDPSHDMVVVVRWITNRAVNTFMRRVLDAIN